MTNVKVGLISFNSAILSLLITATLTLFTFKTNAEYLDIAYRDGLLIRANVNIDNIIYIKAEKYEQGDVLGLGLGYKSPTFNAIISVNQLTEDVKSYNSQIEAYYYDVNYSYFCSMSISDTSELGYEIGVGYAINEKTSVVASHSNKGAMIGLRRWF